MLHRLLVTATDLEQWADLLEGKATFPELLRRLIVATSPQLSSLSFSSAEGVQLGGWDGLSTSSQPSAFVPACPTGWELGTNQDRKGKADDDYDKRTADPLGLVAADSAFIFCTPRRWGNKDAWATNRRAERHWREVRVYDADDLATWLAAAPAVHIWLSHLLNKRPAGVSDLETFWHDWAGVITPPVPVALPLAGRYATSEALQTWLNNPATAAKNFSLVADSRKEAIAILASAVLTLPDDERAPVMARTVVVESQAAWQELTTTAQSLLLIPMFRDDEAIASAVRQGHQVFLPLDHTDHIARAHKPVRLAREVAARILVDDDFPSGQADTLAGVARRSMAAFRRHRALHPLSTSSPIWATAANAQVLLAAALIGAWNEDEREAVADQATIAALAGVAYEELRAQLSNLASAAEPPVRLVGTIWYVVDRADLWALLARYQTPALLDRFSTAALQILGTPLPRYELPAEQQAYADLHGMSAANSGLLRKQVADTLAFLGADEASQPIGSSLVSRVVRELLRRAHSQANVWLSLADYMPQLAEASPDEFLTGVSAGLQGVPPPIMVLFEERPGLLHTTAQHPGLLWALESLAWSPFYIGYATRILARLTELDPGGNLVNRPMHSLVAVFLPWFPQTSATLPQRLAALDVLRRTKPDIAWLLLLSLLPNNVSNISAAHEPAWREWAPAERSQGPNPRLHHAAIESITERVIHDVGTDVNRWLELIEDLPDIGFAHRVQAFQLLQQLTIAVLTDEQRDKLVKQIRELIHRQRSFEPYERSLSFDELKCLKNIHDSMLPDDPIRRFAWLFGSWPLLLSGELYRGQGAREGYEKKVAKYRLNALIELLATIGLTGVLNFIPHVEAPAYLGIALGERVDITNEQKDQLLTRYLASTVEAEHHFALGLVRAYRLAQAEPWEWATAHVRRHKSIWSSAQQAAWLDTFPSTPITWQLAAELGSETERLWWMQASPYGIDDTDIPVAFEYFLQYGRPLVATYLACVNERVALPTSTLTDALEAALSIQPNSEPRLRVTSHDYTRLLARLADAPDVDEQRLALLEFELLSAQYHRRLSAKVLYRALCSSPNFFAQVVQMCSFSDDRTEQPTAEGNRRWSAHKLLHGWSTLPGTQADQTLSSEQLRIWVQAARVATAELGRSQRGEILIGEMLSASPNGIDGYWPHEAVRDAIEMAVSEYLEHGFSVGTTNNRSFTVRNPYDGGAQERGVAAMFTTAAEALALDWPRTSAALRRQAESYLCRAIEEDNDANLEHDLDR